jgi:hypothetical protein
MTKKPAAEEQVNQVLEEVAASSMEEFDEILDTFEDVEERIEPVLRPGQLEAIVDVSSTGHGKANRTFTELGKEAAADNGLSSTQFGALRVQYSRATQSMLCTPVETYVKAPNMVEVRWSPDAKEMRIVLGDLLKTKGWNVATGYVRRIPVTFIKRHPKIGSAFVMDLKKSTIQDGPTRIRKQNEREEQRKAAEAQAQQKAAAEAQAQQKAAEAQAQQKAATEAQAQQKANQEPQAESAPKEDKSAS